MAAPTAKPVIIMVSGAWCSPAHWKLFTEQLAQAGFDYNVVTLASFGVKEDPGNAMRLDATLVANRLRIAMAEGRDTILVMHSYGGIPGSEAVAIIHEEALKTPDTPTGNIRRLVYVMAQVPGKDEAPFAPVVEFGHPQIAIADGLMRHVGSAENFFQDLSADDATHAVELMEPMAVSAFTQPTSFVGRTEYHIPCTYITCTEDVSAPPGWSEPSIARLRDAGLDVTAKTIAAGHFPMMSQPECLLRLIRDDIGV